MKRGDFPSAVYVASLLLVAAAPPPTSPPLSRESVESSLNRARRVLITNNYEC